MTYQRASASSRLTLACVAKHKLAPAPPECWIVADPIARLDHRLKTKAVAGAVDRLRVLLARSGRHGER